jgi:predicted  nucleic acid-binding Zn-ribbon protein
MQLEERKLELSTEEKRERERRLDERLSSVRNLREEAAVSAELEMVRTALQNYDQEALTLMDQLRRVEERLAEGEIAFAEASELVEPKKNELVEQRAEAMTELDSLESQRSDFAGGLVAGELKVYDAIRSGGRRIAVSELTEDGACGHCYGVVPLQVQNEVRHGDALIRCEGCGVILAAPEPAPEEAATEAADESEDADTADATDAEEDDATDAEEDDASDEGEWADTAVPAPDADPEEGSKEE